MSHWKNLVFFAMLCIFAQIGWAAPAHNTQTLTLSILSFSEYPNTPKTHLCIYDNQNQTLLFQKYARLSGYQYTVRNVDPASFVQTPCQAVFFSTNISLATQNQILNNNIKRRLVSFTNNDKTCDGLNIFCIYEKNQQAYFNVNLDALNLAKVRMDPRVLLLTSDNK